MKFIATILKITFFLSFYEIFSSPSHSAQEILDQSKESQEAFAKQIEGFLKSFSEYQYGSPRQPPAHDEKPACTSQFKQDQSNPKASNEILVFVSFSMPESALKSLFEQAKSCKNQKVRLVVRGLVNDSFAQTQSTVGNLGITVDIDPTLFEKYSITHVPTFVHVSATENHILRGNVSLEFAQEQFASLKKRAL